MALAERLKKIVCVIANGNGHAALFHCFGNVFIFGGSRLLVQLGTRPFAESMQRRVCVSLA